MPAKPPLSLFRCEDHEHCVRINRRHTALEAYIRSPFHVRQMLWDISYATAEQRLWLYLAEGFPPLGKGKLPGA